MIKTLSLFISLIFIILFNIKVSNGINKKVNFNDSYSLSIKKDTTKKQSKQPGAIAAIISKLIKPFKFRSNERIRVVKILHDYIVKDSTTAAAELKSLQAQVPALSAQLATLKHPLTSLKNTPPVPPVIPSNGNKTTPQQQQTGTQTKPADTTKTSSATANTDDAAPGTPPIPPANNVALQQKLNVVRKLFKAPFTDTIYSKNHDSTIIRKFSIAHTAKVLGFYADTSKKTVDRINFKLITTLVYAINADEPSAKLGSNAAIIDSAQKYGCDVMLSLYTTGLSSTERYLKNDIDRGNIIKRSMTLLQNSGATSVNINFAGLNSSLKEHFVTFVNSMFNAYKENHKDYKISVTLPGDDKLSAYNLTELDRFTQYFIIDYTLKPAVPGALAPLNDDSPASIQTCFSIYLNKGIATTKFILGVPYYGAVWEKESNQFKHYITYS